MKKIKSILVIIATCVILTNCSSFSDVGKVLRNEKMGSTDEFLIKKREPLTQPPDYNTLPTPNSDKTIKEKKISEILNKSKNTNNKRQNKNSSTEQSIIEQIKQ